MNMAIIRSFIQKNGHHTSGYYKQVNFKRPLKVKVWNEETEEFDKPVMATGMFVEDDVAPCGHYCEEPFVYFIKGDQDSLPLSAVDERYHSALEDRLSEGDAGIDKWGN